MKKYSIQRLRKQGDKRRRDVDNITNIILAGTHLLSYIMPIVTNFSIIFTLRADKDKLVEELGIADDPEFPIVSDASG